jgi:hypothetical protein
MTTEQLIVSLDVDASAAAVFAVLADPTTHPAIDGTGWLVEAIDTEPITAAGQVFRMAMFHTNLPEGHYEMSNIVRVLDRPRAIAWEPAQPNAEGVLETGGWTWRYDLEPLGGHRTRVTLTYDWSAVPEHFRAEIQFPPFPTSHVEQSLRNLADLAVARV